MFAVEYIESLFAVTGGENIVVVLFKHRFHVQSCIFFIINNKQIEHK